MIFPVNDLVRLLITYLVYSVHYLVCFLLTTRTENTTHNHVSWDLWFTITVVRQ